MSSNSIFNLEDILLEIPAIENNIPSTNIESVRPASNPMLQEPVPKIFKSNINTKDTITLMAKECNAVQHKSTPWHGTPDQYSSYSVMWRAAAEDPAIVKGFGGERGVCLALMQTLPAEHRSRIGPFLEKQVKAKEFYSSLLLDEFDRHFIDRDREA